MCYTQRIGCIGLTLHRHTHALGGVALIVVGHLGPVDNLPEVGHVLGAAVLVLEVVGVLPHIQAQDGLHGVGGAFHERVILVGGAADAKLAISLHTKPCPARAELASGGSVELLLHGVHRAKGLVNGRGQSSGRTAGLLLRAHAIPEEAVVVVAATRVTDGTTSLQGTSLEVQNGANSILTGKSLVDVGHVGGVVLVMVKLHGGRVDDGLQGVVSVRKIWKGVRPIGVGRRVAASKRESGRTEGGGTSSLNKVPARRLSHRHGLGLKSRHAGECAQKKGDDLHALAAR
mmetsp:Transcript_31628/g.54928  ORF Transcript_31628/g.54928 Transcript_31628/m.54928 type:complete len:288 (+) Transcript_31628:205-1068(+)